MKFRWSEVLNSLLMLAGLCMLIVLLLLGYRFVSVAIGPITFGLEAPQDGDEEPSTNLEEPVICHGPLPSRLVAGDVATVSFDPPLRNNVRSHPGQSYTLLGKLEPGEEVEILDGPVCAGGMYWWRVTSLDDYLTGWTPEGDSENYWLIPR
ncbi:MAG: SH3 domain-containing protein [Chloroflexi bacterium]|nr:SH3 domain-containing protein [Chloroflexota bacterium]